MKSKRWLALWLSKESEDILKANGVDKEELHLTCYFSPNNTKFIVSEPINTIGVITEIVEWKHANVCVALLNIENNLSQKYSDHYNCLYGEETLKHKPHVTLGGEYKKCYDNLIGKKVYFCRFGTSLEKQQ